MFYSAAATLISPGLVCLGETATFNCTSNSVITWQYSGNQVGDILSQSSPTAVTTNHTVNNIALTVTLISNDNDVLVSSLSFIADMLTNGQVITCVRGIIREDAIIQVGSGKDYAHVHVLIEHTFCFLPIEFPPVLSVVDVVSVVNNTDTTTLTILWNIANGITGIPTIVVDPDAPITPLVLVDSNTYSTTVALLYNTNYSIETAASNCAGMNSSRIFLSQGRVQYGTAIDHRVCLSSLIVAIVTSVLCCYMILKCICMRILSGQKLHFHSLILFPHTILLKVHNIAISMEQRKQK